MEVVNEMEIFITLTKYNTCQQCKEGKPIDSGDYLGSIFTPLTIVPNVFRRNQTYPLMFIGWVYNIYGIKYSNPILRIFIQILPLKYNSENASCKKQQ